MPRLALNAELTLENGQAPEWVEVIPAPDADGYIAGRDGRRWRWDAEAQNSVMAAFNERGIELVMDWEHATQRRAQNGDDAPAAAWHPELEIRGGALLARTNWTPRAKAQVENREYRFLSPVFDYAKDTLRIVRMVSVGLTNTPNLRLQALNSEEETAMNRSAMLAAAISAVLGLGADATDDAIAQGINKMQDDLKTAQAANSEQPSLDRYVPRGDYDNLVARAQNAEQALKARDTADHKKAVDDAIDGALKAGKITPATEDYHRAACSDAEGLERFKAFVGAAVAVGDDTNLGGRKPAGQPTALNAEQKDACRLLGISEADFIAELDGDKETK